MEKRLGTLHEQNRAEAFGDLSYTYIHPSHASQRPYWEPPLLDHRRYEEGGRMYYSLHRHPKATISPEEWYDETDATIEADLACEYRDWIYHQWLEANKIDDIDHLRRAVFYGPLLLEIWKEAEEADHVTFEKRGNMVDMDALKSVDRESVPMDGTWTIGLVWDAEIKIWRDVMKEERRFTVEHALGMEKGIEYAAGIAKGMRIRLLENSEKAHKGCSNDSFSWSASRGLQAFPGIGIFLGFGGQVARHADLD